MHEPPRRDFDHVWLDADRDDRRDRPRLSQDAFVIGMAAFGSLTLTASIIFIAAVILFEIVRFLGALL